jgi:S-formylglutathione hydrolase FrmB
LAPPRGPGIVEEVPIRPWSVELRGRLEEATIVSAALRGNPLGDPHERPVWVYLPPAYESDPPEAYPSIYLIQGLTGQIDMWRNRTAFRPSVVELVDELFADESVPPALVVFVDAWTSLGGSQFLDSPATGNYHTYLCDEVVPWVDAHYRTIPEREQRAITGKSSGGYGAMVTPMLRPDLWGGLATHAGDALFENCYLPEFRMVARILRDEYGGSYERFWQDFRSRPAFGKESDNYMLDVWCMAACYSADPDGSVRLPFDPATGRIQPEIWERWLAWDPVRMVPDHAEILRGLRAIYIDSGTRDEFYLDLGAEAFRAALARSGVTDVFFELFDGTHGQIEHRYPGAIRYLAERLAAPVVSADPVRADAPPVS